MTTISIDTPYTFTYAIQTLMRNILEKTCQKHLPFTDCDTFVEAVFKSFIAEGADIIKQLVAIKQNANHDIFKDHQCKQALQQNWFLFINQCINFGRATPASNGIFTDDDQLTHEDPKGVDFTKCFDNFLYKEILDIRGIPTKGPGLANAIKIRHDLAKLIIQHFVQPTFTNQLISLKDLVEHNDYLLKENLELKRSTLEPAPKPAPKRHKPNGDSEDLQTNADSDAFVQAVAEAVEEEATKGAEATKEEATKGAEATKEEATKGAEATEEEAAEETHKRHKPNGDSEDLQTNADSDSVAKAFVQAVAEAVEERVEEEPEKRDAETFEEALEEEGAQGAEATEEEATKDAKNDNPWVEICDKHNDVMSKINPDAYKLKKSKKDKRGNEMCKNVDKGFLMLLIRDIKNTIGVFHEFDVNVDKPGKEMLNTLCDVLADNWVAIEVGLSKRE